jgi:hypothetical protein
MKALNTKYGVSEIADENMHDGPTVRSLSPSLSAGEHSDEENDSDCEWDTLIGRLNDDGLTEDEMG